MASDAAAPLELASCCPSATLALTRLSGPLRRWFGDCFGQPTCAQRFAWPALTAGKNLLLGAPTGSGKTLAAFLPVVDQLLSEPFCSSLRCLYVSPLKALATDVRRNLRAHLY